MRRIDPDSGKVLRSLRAGHAPVALAVGEGAVWVSNADDDSVSRIDPRTSTVTKAISVGDQPAAVATGAGSVCWPTAVTARSRGSTRGPIA